MEQKNHDEIKSEVLSYVGKLQLSAAMLTTPDKNGFDEEKSKRSKKNPHENERDPPYVQHENETVSPYLQQQTDTVLS